MIYVVFIVLCQAAGIFGALFTRNSIRTWYNGLIKPAFNPPNWVFGPVWTILYTLMGISGAILWQNRNQSQNAKLALIFFFIQLALNAIWTPLFFGSHKLGLAFVEIIFMWVFILLTIIFAWKVKSVAGALLIPYLLWVSFASLLNFSLWRLNK
jgi:translocator protein